MCSNYVYTIYIYTLKQMMETFIPRYYNVMYVTCSGTIDGLMELKINVAHSKMNDFYDDYTSVETTGWCIQSVE